MPGSIKNRLQVIYVQDLAHYYYQAYLKRVPGIKRILVCHKEAPYMNEIYTLLCQKAGIRKPCNIPKFIICISRILQPFTG